MMRQARALAMAMLILAVAGCRAAPPTEASVAGTWRLERTGNKRIPATTSEQNQLPDGTLLLAPDGSFVVSGTYTIVRNGVRSGPQQMRGRWSLDGDSVRLETPDGGGGAAQVRGDRLVMDLNGRPDGVWVYRHATASATGD